MDLAQSLKIAIMKSAIESVPRTIIPATPRNDIPITTKPAVVKAQIKKAEENTIKKTPKQVEKPVVQKIPTEQKQQLSPKVYEFDGVHLDIYDYFDLSPSNVRRDEVSKLMKIQEWAVVGGKSIGEGLSKIERVKGRMGRSKVGYDGLVELYNYIRVRELR